MKKDLLTDSSEDKLIRKVQMRVLDIFIEVNKICKKHDIPIWINFGTLLGAVRHGGFIPWDDDIDVSIMQEDLFKLQEVLKKELPEQFVVQYKTTDKNYFLDSVLKVRDTKSKFPIEIYKTFKDQGLLIDIIPMEKMPSAKFKKIVRKINKYPYLRRRQIALDGKSNNILGLILNPFSSLLIDFAHWYSKYSSTKLIGFNYIFVAYHYGDIRFNLDDIFPLRTMKFEGEEFNVPNKTHEVLTVLYGDYMQLPPVEKRKIHSTKIEVYD